MRPRWTRKPGESSIRKTGVTREPRVPRDSGIWHVENALAAFRRGSDRSDGVPRRSRQPHDTPAVTQSRLEEAAHAYRHVREEHRRARPGSRARRHLEARMEELRRRFERLRAAAQR